MSESTSARQLGEKIKNKIKQVRYKRNGNIEHPNTRSELNELSDEVDEKIKELYNSINKLSSCKDKINDYLAENQTKAEYS